MKRFARALVMLVTCGLAFAGFVLISQRHFPGQRIGASVVDIIAIWGVIGFTVWRAYRKERG